MPIFKATVTAHVPSYMSAEVEVDARDEEDASFKIEQMYEKDELDFDQPEVRYDSAEIDDISFHTDTGDGDRGEGPDERGARL
jgi:hypothetical protein